MDENNVLDVIEQGRQLTEKASNNFWADVDKEIFKMITGEDDE